MISSLVVTDLALSRGDRRLFDGFNLAITAGEVVALVGANGAGKTSLLRAIAGFILPQAGEIAFADADGPVPAEDARAADLHLLGHHDGLKSGRTAGEELLFQVQWSGGTRASADAASASLDLARLKPLEVRKLSAGQRRRVALARLVASPRALWLLDEPLTPLDAGWRGRLGELMIEHLKVGGMILAAVHDPLPIPARTVEITA